MRRKIRTGDLRSIEWLSYCRPCLLLYAILESHIALVPACKRSHIQRFDTYQRSTYLRSTCRIFAVVHLQQRSTDRMRKAVVERKCPACESCWSIFVEYILLFHNSFHTLIVLRIHFLLICWKLRNKFQIAWKKGDKIKCHAKWLLSNYFLSFLFAHQCEATGKNVVANPMFLLHSRSHHQFSE